MANLRWEIRGKGSGEIGARPCLNYTGFLYFVLLTGMIIMVLLAGQSISYAILTVYLLPNTDGFVLV